MSKSVGPILRMSDDVDAVVAAIVDDNPGQEVTVVDRGAYTRVSGDGELRVTRESIERHLGRDFAMRPRDAGLVVRHAGTVVPGDVTVADSGISALDIVNVGWAE